MLLWSDRVSVKIASPSLSFRQPDDDRPRKRHVRGDEGKAVGCVPPTALLFVEPRPAFIRHRHGPPPSGDAPDRKNYETSEGPDRITPAAGLAVLQRSRITAAKGVRRGAQERRQGLDPSLLHAAMSKRGAPRQF